LTDVVVVGGGVGGLVVARRLALGGRRVTLLEAGGHLGGTVSHHTVGGLDLDAGAESFALRGGTVVALATELGLGEDIVSPNPQGAWLQPVQGQAVPLPQNALLGIPGLPLAPDVLAILGQAAALRAHAESFLPGSFAADSHSLGELVRRRMGQAVLDNLVAPIVRGVHSQEPDDLDLDRVAPGLRAAMIRTGSLAAAVLELRSTAARAGSAVAGIRGGVHRLVDNLEADLLRLGVDIRFGTRVDSASAEGVVAGGRSIPGQVIVATPGIIGPPVDAGRLAVLATIVLDAPELDTAPRGTGLLVAAGSPGIQARALTHSTAKWPWLAQRAGGKHVVRLSYATELDNHAEVARADTERLLGIELPAARVIDYARVHWRRPAPVTQIPAGMFLVGETISGTGLASVVAQAEAQAVNVLQDIAE